MFINKFDESGNSLFPAITCLRNFRHICIYNHFRHTIRLLSLEHNGQKKTITIKILKPLVYALES